MRRWAWLLVLGACGGAPSEPRTAPRLPEPDPVLREVTRDAVHRGERAGWSLERVGQSRFAVADRAHVEAVTVPARSCRVFVLVGAAGVREIGAALYLPDGRRLARDIGREQPPAIGACAGEVPLAAFWHVSVRGAGLVRGLSFAVDRDAADQLGLSEVPLESALTLALRRRGFSPEGEPRVLSLAEAEVLRFPLTLDAHRCLAIVVRGLRATLDLREGTQSVARDGAGGDQAAQLCAGAEPRTLVGQVVAREAGEVRVQRYGADRQSIGGEEALWLGERLAPSGPASPPPGARALDLGPAEVREVSLPRTEGCTRVRLRAGKGSRGVWLGRPATPRGAVEECVTGNVARFGSVGGGRVWLSIGGESAALTPRPPGQRNGRR